MFLSQARKTAFAMSSLQIYVPPIKKRNHFGKPPLTTHQECYRHAFSYYWWCTNIALKICFLIKWRVITKRYGYSTSSGIRFHINWNIVPCYLEQGYILAGTNRKNTTQSRRDELREFKRWTNTIPLLFIQTMLTRKWADNKSFKANLNIGLSSHFLNPPPSIQQTRRSLSPDSELKNVVYLFTMN